VQILQDEHRRPGRDDLLGQHDPGIVQQVPSVARVEAAGSVQSEGEAQDLASGQAGEDPIGAGVGVQPEPGTQNVTERGVRHTLPVRQTAPGIGHRRRTGLAEAAEEALDQGRLADARLTEDGDQPRPIMLDHPAIGRLQRIELVAAPHKAARPAAHGMRTGRRTGGDQRRGRQPRPTGARPVDHVGELEPVPGQRHGTLGHQDPAGAGTLAQRRRGAHRFATGGHAERAFPAQHLAGGDTRVDGAEPRTGEHGDR
jgi:hypothetical protein